MDATIITDRFPWVVAKGFTRAPAVPDKNLDDQVVSSPLALAMDVINTESVSFSATPTRSLIEDGENISDHVTLMPMKLQIEAIISNTPIPVSAAFMVNAALLPNPAKEAFKFLKGLRDARMPFTFVGGFQVYKGMVLTEFTPTRTSKTGNVLQFSATMEQIKTVSTGSVPVDKIKPAAQKAAAPKKSKGTQTAPKASIAQATKVDATGDTIAASAHADIPLFTPNTGGASGSW